MQFINPQTEDMPVTVLVALLISSLGGTLASVMLSTSIVNEKSRRVYDLFLIRPVKRRDIVLSKFISVYFCLVVAVFIALIVGIVYDVIANETLLSMVIDNAIESLVISLSAMAIASSAGILIGMFSNSVSLAAILAIYLGNQLSMISVLPGFFIESINPAIFAGVLDSILTIVIIYIAIMIFNKKQF
jgi:ABC-type transport system involved in multi-copper enzyme maturation permease subunit